MVQKAARTAPSEHQGFQYTRGQSRTTCSQAQSGCQGPPSGHAPHSAQPVPTIEAWWDRLGDVLRRHQRPTDLPVICVDANAEVGSQTRAAIGCHAAEEENASGQIFRAFLEVNQLWAPATFAGRTHATLKSTDKACARLELLQFFRLWRDAGTALHCPDRVHRCRLARARRHIQLSRLQKDLASRLRQDKRRYIVAMSDKYADATSEKDQKALFQALQCLRPTPSKGKSKPWCSRWQTMLPSRAYSGMYLPHRKVVGSSRRRPTLKRSLGEGSHYCFQDLPTLLQLEQAIHGMSDGKAPGPAGIGPAFWKAHVAKSAKALLPIILKSHVRLTEPVQNRGTLLISMFKQAGAACDPRSYRSIALLNPTAKIAHKLLRPGLVEELQRTAEPLHQGCQPGSYGIALSHYVMTHARIADTHKMSWAIFFLDLSAAYYRLLRESLHGMGDDSAVANVLHRLKVPPSTIDEVRSFASCSVVLDKASPTSDEWLRQSRTGHTLPWMPSRASPALLQVLVGGLYR